MEDKIGFGIVDYIVFIGTLLISMFIGVFYAFIQKQTTNADLLVGGRSMAIVPISLSLLATYMSAILVLGFAGEIYSYGTIITEVIYGAIIWVPIGGFLFLPTLYGLKLTSAYEYLELRFESKHVRNFATGTFILQIVLYMGVVVYAPSLALNIFLDFPIWASIILLGGCAGAYTSWGGLKAVVWTDVFQIAMMFAGMLAIIIQGVINVGGPKNVYEIANKHERIEFFNFKVDPFTRHTTLSIFFGNGIFWLSSYGCHQTTVQRYCSMSSLKRAFASLILTGPLLAFTICLASLSGLVIFANFAGCDPLTLGVITKSDQIAPHFVITFLSKTSGLVGLFMACLYSGALSTVSSGLNSLAAVTWEDFCKKTKYCRNMKEDSQAVVTKVICFTYSVITIGMGFVASTLGGVLNAAIIVNGAVAGPLLGVFILGVLMPFTNKYGAFIGMLTAHLIVFWISIGGLYVKKPPPLPLRIDECPADILTGLNMTEILERQKEFQKPMEELDWPFKIYSVSYLLYPLIGTLITVIVGTVVSIFTGCWKMTKDREQFIHPWIVKLMGSSSSSQNGQYDFDMTNITSPMGKNGDPGGTPGVMIKNGVQNNNLQTDRKTSLTNVRSRETSISNNGNRKFYENEGFQDQE